jgi:hypothetical protein
MLEVAKPSGSSAARLSGSKPSHDRVMVKAAGREGNGREWKGMERKELSHMVLLYIMKGKSRKRNNNISLYSSHWSVFTRLQH